MNNESYDLELELRSDPIKWAFWKLKDVRGNPWKARWYQKKLLNDMRDGTKRLAIRMGRRVGKCLPGWVNIFDPTTGKQVTIQELFMNQKASVVSMNHRHKLMATSTDIVMDNGVKEVFRVQLKSGRCIDATGNHPLYTIQGWKEIDDLVIGNKIATPRSLNYFGDKEIPDHEIKFLAYMIGDGSCKSKTLRFTNTNVKIVEDFIESVRLLGSDVVQYACNKKNDYNIIGLNERKGKIGKIHALNCLKEHGLYEKGALEKEIPSIIFELKKENIALFLSRLFSTDGWASANFKKKAHLEIGYSSSSEKLIRGVQHLLLRFGIQSYLKEKHVKYKDERRRSYTLTIHGSKYVEEFASEIGIYGKEEAINRVLEHSKLSKEKDDHLPIEIMDEVEELKKEKNIRSRDLKLPRCNQHHRYRKQYGPQRKTLEHFANVLGSDRLLDLSTSDLFWDEIVSIESIGMHQTYDLSIPETKNFVANDIIVHNSETLVVFALWYAFHHENARILIAAPYENQVRLLFMRLAELIDHCDELGGAIVTRTKNPFVFTFGNGSSILGFTVGATSGQSGASVRGQRADWIFIDEVDYCDRGGIDAVTAIALEDPKRIGIWCSSTPTGKRDFFYEVCTNVHTGYKSYHFPSMVNPDWDDKMEGEMRATMTSQGYIHEVLADFGEETVGVFNKEYVERSIRQFYYSYRELNSWEIEYFERANIQIKDVVFFGPYANKNKPPHAFRIIGVDWDKYGEATQIVITEFDELLLKFRVCGRYEIPRGEFTLDNAVKKIIELNEIYDPKFIYVDRGFGKKIAV